MNDYLLNLLELFIRYYNWLFLHVLSTFLKSVFKDFMDWGSYYYNCYLKKLSLELETNMGTVGVASAGLSPPTITVPNWDNGPLEASLGGERSKYFYKRVVVISSELNELWAVCYWRGLSAVTDDWLEPTPADAAATRIASPPSPAHECVALYDSSHCYISHRISKTKNRITIPTKNQLPTDSQLCYKCPRVPYAKITKWIIVWHSNRII